MSKRDDGASTVPIPMRFPKRVLRDVDELADIDGDTRSGFVRRAVVREIRRRRRELRAAG
jgi:metal-responsive CopG/Arc/MetJ family transcriptional regulator